MSEEKRTFCDYTVEQSIFVGNKEVLLGVDEQHTQEHRFMVCYCSYDNPLGVPWPTEAVGTDDYLEAMQVFLDRVQAQVELVRNEQEQYRFDKTPFTTEDCIPDDKRKSIVGKVVVLNERIVERIKENSYAVKFQRFSKPTKQVTVYRLKGSLKDAKKIGGLRGLYLHYCYKLGILPKNRKQNYARLHYLLKDDLMKMEAITQETRLLCHNHIDTAEQLCDYKCSLQSEIAELTEQRKGLYSQSRKVSGEEKEAVKARLSEITERMKFLRKEVRLCEGIEARSDTLKEKLKVIRADENRQQGKELRKDEHRRRSGRTNREDELGGI